MHEEGRLFICWLVRLLQIRRQNLNVFSKDGWAKKGEIQKRKREPSLTAISLLRTVRKLVKLNLAVFDLPTTMKELDLLFWAASKDICSRRPEIWVQRYQNLWIQLHNRRRRHYSQQVRTVMLHSGCRIKMIKPKGLVLDISCQLL